MFAQPTRTLLGPVSKTATCIQKVSDVHFYGHKLHGVVEKNAKQKVCIMTHCKLLAKGSTISGNDVPKRPWTFGTMVVVRTLL